MTRKQTFIDEVFERTNKWKIFFVVFLITFVFTYPFAILLSYITDTQDNLLGKLVICSVLGVMFGGLFSSMVGMYRISSKFYKFADEIETMIRNNEPIENVKEKLLELSKQSVHRTTGDRVRELAKMAEIKYDVILLNRHAR